MRPRSSDPPALRAITRRRFLALAAAAAAAPQVVPRSARGATSRIEIHGTGRVREPIPGVTVPSPSDFGFSVDATGGYFLCSMFGPETGGFLGCQLMTVQGVVTPGSLEVRRGAAIFSGRLDIFLFPNVFTTPPEPWLLAAANDFTVNVVLGGRGKGRLVLHIPAVTEAIGGDTGGVLDRGLIARRRRRR